MLTNSSRPCLTSRFMQHWYLKRCFQRPLQLPRQPQPPSPQSLVSELERPPSSSRQSRSISTETETKTMQTTQAQQGTTAATATTAAAAATSTTSHVQHAHKKRKTAFSNKSSKSQSKMDYPSDCNLSADNEKRGRFLPCDHAGPCGPSCSCVDEQVHCEKACGCPLVSPALPLFKFKFRMF